MGIKQFYLGMMALLLPYVTIVGQEMDFETYNPKSTLVVPEHEVKKAKFPFIDVHSHQRDMSTEALIALTKDMDALNEGIMVTLSGGSGERLNNMLQSIRTNYPNRFVVFANVDFEGVGTKGWSEKAAKQLEIDIRNGAKGLKIFKSLGLRYIVMGSVWPSMTLG